MYLDELQSGDSIVVEAKSATGLIKMDTVVVELTEEDEGAVERIKDTLGTDKFVVVEVLKDSDSVIVFDSSTVTCSMIATNEGKPWQWENVAIFKYKFPSVGSVHLIVSPKEGRTFNRRREYRLQLSCDATFKMEGTEGRFKAMLRDISRHGLGFVTDAEVEPGTNIALSFESSGQEFVLTARVIRVVNATSGRLIVGCILTSDDGAISRFINEQQMLRMRV